MAKHDELCLFDLSDDERLVFDHQTMHLTNDYPLMDVTSEVVFKQLNDDLQLPHEDAFYMDLY